MEITKTDALVITDENYCNAAQELYGDYGLEFDKEQVLTYVLDAALGYPGDVTEWRECLTPEQVQGILKYMRDVFSDYMQELSEAHWDAIMKEE